MSTAPTNALVGLARVAALLATILFVAPFAADAGTIGFRTDAAVTAGPGVDVKVTLTHTGDETADDVRVQAQLLERRIDGETFSSIAPGHTEVWNFHLFDEIAKGVYVVLLRTHYTDTNGYPFEAISTAPTAVGVTAAPKIIGNFDVSSVPLDREVRGQLGLRLPAKRSGDVDVQIVAPAGVRINPDVFHLRFDSAGKATADFRIRNLKMLVGSAINIFALVTGTDAGFPQVDTIRGIVTIAPKTVPVTATTFYQAAAAVFGIFLLMEGISRARDGRVDSE